MTEVVVTENKGLTKDGVATNVAINKAPVVAETPAAGFSLRSLSFTDASNYFMRFMSSTVTQNTADSKGNVRYVDNRYRSVGGSVASWNNGSDPARQADVHWTGTAWAGCALNFESAATVRDADGNGNHNYCDNLLTGRDKRAMFDVSGKKIVDVLTDAAKAGYGTDLGTITNTDGSKTALGTMLGDATFPNNSKIGYTMGTDLTTAIAYYPGSINWGYVQTSTPCNTKTFASKAVSTLEEMLTSYDGKLPCNVGGGSYTITGKNGVSLNSGPRSEAWGNTVMSLGNIGTAPTVSSDSQATSFYTGNTRLRVAFGSKSGDGGAATFYACQQRYNGSADNCNVIGNGGYVIKTVGGARTLSFTGLPALASALNFTRVLVERGGKVYYGYQARPATYSNARLNSVASAAMLAILGLPAVNVDTPLALTPASYQGTWDATPDDMTSQSVTTYTFSATGQVVEPSIPTSTTTVTSFNAATGAFVWKITDIDGYITDVTGKLDFLTGTGTASFSNNHNESRTAKFLRQ